MGTGIAHTPNDNSYQLTQPVESRDGTIQFRILLHPNACYPQVKDLSKQAKFFGQSIWEFIYWKTGGAEKDTIVSFPRDGIESAKDLLRVKYPTLLYKDTDIDVVEEVPQEFEAAFDHQAAIERKWGYATDDDWGDDDERWLVYDEKEQIICRGVQTPGMAAYIAMLQNNRLSFKQKQANKGVAKKFTKIKRDWDLYCASFDEMVKKNWFKCCDALKPLCCVVIEDRRLQGVEDTDKNDFQTILNTYVFWRFFANYAERWAAACRGVGECEERKMFYVLPFFTWGSGVTHCPDEFHTFPFVVPFTSSEAMREVSSISIALKGYRNKNGTPMLSVFAWETIQRMVEFALERIKTHGVLTEDLLERFPEVKDGQEDAADGWTTGGISVALPSSPPAIRCPRCMKSSKGCEFYDGGTCRAVCYATYPPQWDPCVYESRTTTIEAWNSDSATEKSEKPNPPEIRYCGDAMLKNDIFTHSKYDLKGIDFDHGAVVPSGSSLPGQTTWTTDFRFRFPAVGNLNAREANITVEFTEDGSAIANSAKEFDRGIDRMRQEGSQDFLKIPLKQDK